MAYGRSLENRWSAYFFALFGGYTGRLPSGRRCSRLYSQFFLMRLSAVPEEILPVFEENNRRKWRLLSRRRVTQIKNKRKKGSGGAKTM